MEKFLFVAGIVVCLLGTCLFLITDTSFAAGSCLQSSVKPIKDRNNQTVGEDVTVLCTAHTDASFSTSLPAKIMERIGGRIILSLVSLPGALPVTADSDFEITEPHIGGATTYQLSILGSNGTDFIDTVPHETILQNTFLSVNVYPMAVAGKVWVVSMTNNIVNSATFYLTIRTLFIKHT